MKIITLCAQVARLKAVYRWAVSGTPIQRGLDDLYGLVFFLSKCSFLFPLFYYLIS
jgi:SNF2 family DNA or RNA helicase